MRSEEAFFFFFTNLFEKYYTTETIWCHFLGSLGYDKQETGFLWVYMLLSSSDVNVAFNG